MELGHIPPQDIRAEEAVLGAIILEKGAFMKVNQFLKAEMFYNDSNILVYEAAHQVNEEQLPIDRISITAMLRKTNNLERIGGTYYLERLAEKVTSSANIVTHAVLIVNQYMKRELIRIGSRLVQFSFDEDSDVFELIANAGADIQNVSGCISLGDTISMKNLFVSVLEQMDMSKSTGVVGVPTGFTHLDSLTGGYERGGYNMIAGRPSMGKSCLAFNSAKNIASMGIPTAVFLYESSRLNVGLRLTSSMSRIQYEAVRAGDLNDEDWKQLHRTIAKYEQVPLYIIECKGRNVNSLASLMHSIIATYNIQVWFLDYIQLVPSGIKGSANEQLSYVSNKLVTTLKLTDTTGVVLSQLNRAVEATTQKIPMLSHLRDSGTLEQDADQVYFCYRPEYYGINEIDGRFVYEGQLRVICAKNREGKTGYKDMYFDGNTQYISNYEGIIESESISNYNEKKPLF